EEADCSGEKQRNGRRQRREEVLHESPLLRQ
ncbi:MAG: hypothetical protein ACI9HH_005496, partial [Pseudomonadota bacterium]